MHVEAAWGLSWVSFPCFFFFFEKGGAGLTADAVVDRSGEFGVGGGFLGGWRVHE